MARDDSSQGRCVAERAHRVAACTPSGGEYGGHAEELEAQFPTYDRITAAQQYPIRDRLASYNQVRGLVFGNYAGASPLARRALAHSLSLRLTPSRA
jgi:hypothetical protein